MGAVSEAATSLFALSTDSVIYSALSGLNKICLRRAWSISALLVQRGRTGT